MTNLGRIGVAIVMLALAALGSACSGNSNHPVIVVPISTPTPTVTTTPTPTATPTAVIPAALWVENADSNSVTEFKGATLATPGVSVPTAAVTNMSADLKVDPESITFDSSNNQWVSVCGSTATNGSITSSTRRRSRT
jgi:hypothetical protein